MIRATAELAKLCGFYESPVDEEPPPCDVGALGNAQRVIEAMSDEELMALATIETIGFIGLFASNFVVIA